MSIWKTPMTKCKHRWVPSNFGIKYRTPNHYLYQCTRCSKIIGTLLKEKKCQSPEPHTHSNETPT